MQFIVYYCDLCGMDDEIEKAQHAYRADDNVWYDICNAHLKVVESHPSSMPIKKNSRNQTQPEWDI